jgi:hypothetical protein
MLGLEVGRPSGYFKSNASLALNLAGQAVNLFNA